MTDAIADFTRAIVLNDKYSFAFNKRGIAKFTIGDKVGAIEDFTRAIELDSKYAIAYNNRGVVKFDLGDKEGAVAEFTKAIKLDLEYTIAYNNRGVVKFDLGDKEGALADYSKVSELIQKYAIACNNRGVVKFDVEDGVKNNKIIDLNLLDFKGLSGFYEKSDTSLNWSWLSDTRGGAYGGAYSLGQEYAIPDKKIDSKLPILDFRVRVFFATDRNLIKASKVSNKFGDQRSELCYGYCDVTMPHDHLIGEVETPSWWRFEFREDPEKHVILHKTVINQKEDFFKNLAVLVHDSKGKNAFVFVHGYNVTFEDAAKRTAQISYDLSFDGAPIFYSWPSRGSLLAYTNDEQSIEWAQTNLTKFLKEFFKYSDAENVYLIAHSMGNRALTRSVVALLTDMPSLKNRLKEVILAAPDIDAAVFKRDIAPALAVAGRPVTLYASSEDKALSASKIVHTYPRAGDSREGVLVVPGIETIDATKMGTDLLGHSSFVSRSVLGDIFSLIRTGKRADERFGLRRINDKAGIYWEILP